MSTWPWEIRMARRAAERKAAEPAPEYYMPEGHEGHHEHWDHGGIRCSCGVFFGMPCVIPTDEEKARTEEQWNAYYAGIRCSLCGAAGVTKLVMSRD
jgi:hypothetical protein